MKLKKRHHVKKISNYSLLLNWILMKSKTNICLNDNLFTKFNVRDKNLSQIDILFSVYSNKWTCIKNWNNCTALVIMRIKIYICLMYS